MNYRVRVASERHELDENGVMLTPEEALERLYNAGSWPPLFCIPTYVPDSEEE